VTWGYVSVFSTPKRGSTSCECEDASWVGPKGTEAGDVAGRSLRVVVADGASESLLAGRWARQLCATFGQASYVTTSQKNFVTTYQAATESWGAELECYIGERQERGAPIQWYEEPGLARGAFSTLIVTDVFRPRDGRRRWSAAAIGDSCLFLVRDEQLVVKFPVEDAEQFTSRPSLLPSRSAAADLVMRNMAHCASEWEPGDSFYIATDALAAWFLRADQRGDRPWEILRDLETSDFGMEFEDWVNLERSRGELRDDDTTLIRIDLF
jgi:hypothetical protein